MNIRSVTLELSVLSAGDLLAVLTIPGREGTLTRTWMHERPYGLSEAQLLDFKSWVLTTACNFVELATAHQLELPLLDT